MSCSPLPTWRFSMRWAIGSRREARKERVMIHLTETTFHRLGEQLAFGVEEKEKADDGRERNEPGRNFRRPRAA